MVFCCFVGTNSSPMKSSVLWDLRQIVGALGTKIRNKSVERQIGCKRETPLNILCKKLERPLLENCHWSNWRQPQCQNISIIEATKVFVYVSFLSSPPSVAITLWYIIHILTLSIRTQDILSPTTPCFYPSLIFLFQCNICLKFHDTDFSPSTAILKWRFGPQWITFIWNETQGQSQCHN